MNTIHFAAPAPSEPVVPVRYAVRITVVVCKCCGAQARTSEFLSVSFLKSRALGTPVKHYITCDRAEYNLPVERVYAPQRTIPYCADCATGVRLAHLPPPPSAAGLYDLAEPTLKGVRAPAKPAAKAAARPKLEDLA